MKELPILFSTEMVQAILAGRKTMTRRLVKDKHVLYSLDVNKVIPEYFKDGDGGWCPYGKPGDLLYVRETWFPASINGNKVLVGYHDKDPDNTHEFTTEKIDFYWKQLEKARMIPSIHMPKEAARIWLEVTDIHVERLQDISEEDAIAEGIEVIDGKIDDSPGFRDYLKEGIEYAYGYPTNSFQSLWQSINGPESWDANPWVWCVSYKVLSTTGKP